MGDIERAYHGDRDRAGLLIDVPQLSDAWKAWARSMLAPPRRR